jgi:hypothetical protein
MWCPLIVIIIIIIIIIIITVTCILSFLMPTDYRFNFQQLYALSTLYLCVLYLSQNKQQLVPLTA